jgi:three-Cys-motif partner protein
MATGAGEQFWQEQRLPSVLKHALITRYLPIFAGKTGSRAGNVAYLDGYAGRGRYEDGRPASAELILKIAEEQGARGIGYRLFFHEKDRESYRVLRTVVDEYAARGVHARAERSEVIAGLDDVVDAATGMPLFLFLDPCGLGVPFSVLTQTLTGPRGARWPPTEVLLNFSLEAIRRIGGHVTSPAPTEKTMARLDEALDGSWWRDRLRDGVSDEAVTEIVDGFMARLGQAAGMDIFAIPVLRKPFQKPVYYLVFGTRSPHGLWHLADSTARATDRWWEEVSAREEAKNAAFGQDSLFGGSVGDQGTARERQDAERRERPQDRRSQGQPAPVTCVGISSQTMPSSSRPRAFGVRPPHCLKKNGTPAAREASRMARAHSSRIGR